MTEKLNLIGDFGGKSEQKPVFRILNEVEKPENVDVPFFFREDYFREDSSKYNEHLATMSLVLAMSGFSHFRQSEANRHKNKDADVRYLLTGNPGYEEYDKYPTVPMNFKDSTYYSNEFYHKVSEKDSIAFCMAEKVIGNELLICVVVRGGGYEKEWNSNFIMDPLAENGKYHKGFYDASTTIIRKIDEKLKSEELKAYIGRYRLWIVGYSRGAAVAGITAQRISELLNGGEWKDFGLKESHIFTYTFETPAGICYEEELKFKGIHNTINLTDMITKFVFKNWGFKRPGQDHLLPYKRGASDSDFEKSWGKVEKCMSQYIRQSAAGYATISKDPNFLQNLEKFEREISEKITKGDMQTKYQTPLAYMTNFFMNIPQNLSTKELLTLGVEMLALVLSAFNKAQLSYQANLLAIYFTLNLWGIKPDADFLEHGNTLYFFLSKALSGYGSETVLQVAQVLISIPYNHAPLLCLSWLMSQDSNYPVTAKNLVELSADEKMHLDLMKAQLDMMSELAKAPPAAQLKIS